MKQNTDKDRERDAKVHRTQNKHNSILVAGANTIRKENNLLL